MSTNDVEDGLCALGLPVPEARVLAALLPWEQSTAGELAATTGLSAAEVSRALSGLRSRGLVERVVGRRPAVVFVSPHAGQVAAELEQGAQEQQQLVLRRASQAREGIARVAARAAQRGRPSYELLCANGTSGDEPFAHLRQGKVAHDEVLAGSADRLRQWGPSRACPTRALLVRADDGAVRELRERLQRTPRRAAVELRATDRTHPDLLVLDHQRVRVCASAAYGRVHAWSTDPAHVRAAEELFSLWWVEAVPLLVLPASLPVLSPEPEWDVEEWEPDEAAEAVAAAERGTALPPPAHGDL